MKLWNEQKMQCIHYHDGYCDGYRMQCRDHDPCDTWDLMVQLSFEEETDEDNDRDNT